MTDLRTDQGAWFRPRMQEWINAGARWCKLSGFDRKAVLLQPTSRGISTSLALAHVVEMPVPSKQLALLDTNLEPVALGSKLVDLFPGGVQLGMPRWEDINSKYSSLLVGLIESGHVLAEISAEQDGRFYWITFGVGPNGDALSFGSEPSLVAAKQNAAIAVSTYDQSAIARLDKGTLDIELLQRAKVAVGRLP